MLSYKREAVRAHQLRAALQQAKQEKTSLEILIRIAPSKRTEAEKTLQQMGKIKYMYENLAYVAFISESKEVEELYTQLRTKRKLFRNWLQGMDVVNRVALFPTTTGTYEQTIWNLEQIGVYKAHEYTRGKGSVVAVLDTGVDYEHPELQKQFGKEKGKSFVDDTSPNDDNGHGTHVAGIVAANQYGVAPASQLYSVKMLDSHGNGSESDSIAGIEWAVKKKVDVINMSWGSRMASRALEEMCYYAVSQGVVLVAAAGNESYGASYPASFDDAVLSVAAVTKDNKHPDFSNIYETNDISAPGVDIVSCYPKGYESLSGTSMACPHVTGSIALARAVFLHNIEEKIKETALPLGREDIFGAGLVRVDKIVKQEDKLEQLWEQVKKIVW